ncbi:MAG: class I SAM-dependent methyltransferase [Thermoleophilia bacterium]
MSLGNPEKWAVLEVGAGRGADSIYLAQHGARAHVLDYSPEALGISDKLAQQAGVNVELVQADALNIPFPDETFDLIFHQGFLEHFREPGLILAEQYRVLKQGGYILVDVPQKYCLYTVRKQIAIKRGTWFAGWETQFGPRELEKLLRQAGFNVIASYAWGMTGSYGWGLRNALHRFKSLVQPTGNGNKSDGAGEGNIGAGPVSTRRLLLYLADCIGVVGRK